MFLENQRIPGANDGVNRGALGFSAELRSKRVS
jgi:hypothetical protein